jgi:hypothetical protein
MPGLNWRVAIFREYLADWEFDEHWREFVSRLAGISDDADPRDQQILEDCAIWDTDPATWGSGLIVWSDVCHADRNVVAVTLAGVVDCRGLRCGTVCSSRPGDLEVADLTWLNVPHSGDVSLADLADTFAGWLLDQHRRPVSELLGADPRVPISVPPPGKGVHGEGSTEPGRAVFGCGPG